MNKHIWDKLEDYVSVPENHDLDCDCRRFKIGNTEKFQENAVDHCTCDVYEHIEEFLMYLEK